MFLNIFARGIGHRIETPQFLAVVGIIGRHIAPYAHFSAAIADDNLAVDNTRRAGNCIGFGLVNRNF